MTLFIHEMKRTKWSTLIWTAVIAFMLMICVVIYPEMKPQMTQMTDLFADMGSFTAAFGMDQLNFGEFLGYFAIECGNVLGLGGALFAAVAGISALAKEEKDRTAEFLLTHPVSRSDVVDQKLLAVLAQITLLNLVVAGLTLACVALIGEEISGTVLLLFLGYYLLQVEIGAITFGISAFLCSGAVAVGLGVAFGFYFMNILSNLTEEAEFLKYITPFAYADGAYITQHNGLNGKYLAVGGVLTAVSVAVAFWHYRRKDIRSA